MTETLRWSSMRWGGGGGLEAVNHVPFQPVFWQYTGFDTPSLAPVETRPHLERPPSLQPPQGYYTPVACLLCAYLHTSQNQREYE